MSESADPVLPRPAPTQRYEATVHTDELSLTVQDASAGIDRLDLDRVPDPAGGVRVLVDSDDISRLVAQGFEVRLQRAVPVQPLDPALIAADADVDAWLTARLSPPGEA